MKFVTKREFKLLREAGLISDVKDNKNYCITSQQKKAPRGKHYVEETKKIMEFLKSINK